jgi:hypothetical protein
MYDPAVPAAKSSARNGHIDEGVLGIHGSTAPKTYSEATPMAMASDTISNR